MSPIISVARERWPRTKNRMNYQLRISLLEGETSKDFLDGGFAEAVRRANMLMGRWDKLPLAQQLLEEVVSPRVAGALVKGIKERDTSVSVKLKKMEGVDGKISFRVAGDKD